MRKGYGRVPLVWRSGSMRRIRRTVRNGASVCGLVVWVRCPASVIQPRAVEALPAIHDATVLTGATDKLFSVPIALRSSCLAICQVVTRYMLPLRALAAT
jgi:hypothetical protein